MKHQLATEVQPILVQREVGRQAPFDTAVGNAAWRLTFSTVILPAILLLTYLAQCAWFIQSQSFTFDEPINILSGLEQW